MGPPLPRWLIPPPQGFTADDLLRMRGLPGHTQMIDGSLIFASPQTKWHSRTIGYLENELDRQAPEGLRAMRQMIVRLGERQAPEPDVSVVTAEAYERPEPSDHFFADDVALVVEVASSDTEARDRQTKPLKYAAAGIPHLWRVERDERRTVVYTHRLVPATREYSVTGIHRDLLKVTVPFDIEIDLTAVDRRD
ncbi:Uma2 family endonuclease [Actinomadura fibrosa]|uniref:Uma2 family endonuclease n=1 Tax=Actinomadura fibrosa TaxID=111802 RepID=A0ABW2XMH7_9ACTN|nr:Uma2 family endonuclease [Actinomadura fibrosa]